MSVTNTTYIQSFAVPNYSGALFNKSNTKTPFLNMIAGKSKFTNSVKFALGQEFASEEGSIPNISEDASITGVAATYITRSQKYNVTQIFQEAVAISYAKKSNMGTLGGINAAGQIENPVDELTFQINQKLYKIGRSIEKTFIQGVFNEATADDEVNKTRGMNTAITTNIVDIGGQSLSTWDVNELLGKIRDNGGVISNGLVLWLDTVSYNQLNQDCLQNNMTIAPADRSVNGIQVRSLILPNGEIGIMLGEFIPAGTAFIFNFDAISPVEQPVPGMGNFFMEEKAKSGAGEKYEIFGQIGLDYGMEFYHGKITGIKTTFTKPTGVKYTTSVTASTITVTYSGNDASASGAASPATQTAVVGVDRELTAASKGTLTLSGKTFTGWSTASDGAVTYSAGAIIPIGSINGATGLSANTTLYAVWSANA